MIVAVWVCAVGAIVLLGLATYRIGQIQERNAALQRELDAKRKVIDQREAQRERVHALVRENTRVTPRQKP